MSRLKVAPTYVAKKMRKGSFSVRLTSGKFEGVTYKIHSVEFIGNNLSFQYDFVRIPKTLKKMFMDQPRFRKQFRTVVSNIMYNAIIIATRTSSKVLNK